LLPAAVSRRAFHRSGLATDTGIQKQRVREILGTIPSDVRYVPMDFTRMLVAELQKAGYSERHPLDVSRTTTALGNMLTTGSTESANILGRTG